MFHKMPFILLAILGLAFLLNDWIPPSLASVLYAISLSIKSCIVFLLPLVIFGLLFKTAVQFARKASKWILFILIAVCLSNFISTLLAYCAGTLTYQFDLAMPLPTDLTLLEPAWTFHLPTLIRNDVALLCGLVFGIFFGWAKPSLGGRLASWFEYVIQYILKGILFMIPLFIAGFVVKMNHDQVMSYMIRNYALIFCLIGTAVFSYIGFIYYAASRFRLPVFIKRIQNMMPAAIAGFGSMSSAAAMPLTILGTEKNAQGSSEVSKSSIPLTVNIHLMGDCFAIPIFAFAVMKSFGIADPSFLTYLVFASYFVLAKFSVAAVPGGGILVMLPILESILGFNGEMLSLITALYILFDPVITTANILGNGSFALVLGKLFKTKRLVTA